MYKNGNADLKFSKFPRLSIATSKTNIEKFICTLKVCHKTAYVYAPSKCFALLFNTAEILTRAPFVFAAILTIFSAFTIRENEKMQGMQNLYSMHSMNAIV